MMGSPKQVNAENPHDILMHEMGHILLFAEIEKDTGKINKKVLHSLANQIGYCFNNDHIPKNRAFLKKVAWEVSNYALSDPHEFFAELFVLKMRNELPKWLKKVFNDDIKELQKSIDNILEKAKVYFNPDKGESPPEGVTPQKGVRGGDYYTAGNSATETTPQKLNENKDAEIIERAKSITQMRQYAHYVNFSENFKASYVAKLSNILTNFYSKYKIRKIKSINDFVNFPKELQILMTIYNVPLKEAHKEMSRIQASIKDKTVVGLANRFGVIGIRNEEEIDMAEMTARMKEAVFSNKVTLRDDLLHFSACKDASESFTHELGHILLYAELDNQKYVNLEFLDKLDPMKVRTGTAAYRALRKKIATDVSTYATVNKDELFAELFVLKMRNELPKWARKVFNDN
jgi:hypothetical protein